MSILHLCPVHNGGLLCLRDPLTTKVKDLASRRREQKLDAQVIFWSRCICKKTDKKHTLRTPIRL